MRIFALDGSRILGQEIADLLDCSLDAHEERNFEDGEHKIRPLVSVRDEDVYVIHSLYADNRQSVNDKLCKLLFFIATLKDCGAQRVTAVVPYLCYARKDRRTKARDPVTMRYVASLFEAVHVDRVVTMDVHNLQAFQNAFRCQTEHLEAQKLFVNYFKNKFRSDDELAVMSPDFGGIKRAQQFRDQLSKSLQKEIGFVFMEKARSRGILTGEAVVGDVGGKVVLILDDLINSGSTIARAAAACARMGAVSVYGLATHGPFVGKTSEAFKENALSEVVVSNTVLSTAMNDPNIKEKLIMLSAAPIFSETVRRLNSSGSLASMMEME